jgi:iron complex transport system substrate-binding protein
MQQVRLFLLGLLLWLLPQSSLCAALPQRIVSLGPMNTENVFLLGAGDKLVGTTSYCVRPAAAKETAKVGTVTQFSLEHLLSLHPDLVLATGLTAPEQVEKLRQLGLRVVQFRQPVSFAEICSQFIETGKLLGREEKAQEIVRQAEAKVQAVSAAAAKLPRRTVFLQIGANPLFGAADSSFTQDYIRLSNGVSVLAGQYSGAVGLEQVLALNPEVILVALMGSQGGRLAEEERTRWLGFPFLKATQRGQVKVVSSELVCSPSPPTFAEVLTIIAGLIHPLDVAASR